MVAARLRGAGSDRAVGGAVRSSKPPASSYAPPMTSRVEVFVRSGHTIDLALEDGQDRIFANALHEAWASLQCHWHSSTSRSRGTP